LHRFVDNLPPVNVLLITMLLLTAPPTRSDWIALAKSGFAVPGGRTAADMLTKESASWIQRSGAARTAAPLDHKSRRRLDKNDEAG
jgi:hypothetical protein